jgi:hypothetical protein
VTYLGMNGRIKAEQERERRKEEARGQVAAVEMR